MRNYVHYTNIVNGKPQTNEGITYNVSSSINLRIKGWSVSSNISYNGSNVLVQGRTGGYISNTIAAHKHFFKNNKANVGLSITSPFREHQRSFTEINDPAFYQLQESLSVVRRFNLSLTYIFTKVQADNINKK
jgi:ferric enterobactin receptor